MEIIIHGTKGGYKILYRTANAPYSISRDARRFDSSDRKSIGQSAYAIALVENGYVLSKYLIIRDTERGTTGNIAFAIFLTWHEKIPGLQVKSLLDELTGFYTREYTINGNLKIKQEDWSFVRDICERYNEKIQTIPGISIEGIVQGKEEPAYIYYGKEKELQVYLDSPYQDEYLPYRQVFLVESALKGQAENPLNALKHRVDADLSSLSSLENPRYRLQGFSGKGANGLYILVWANEERKKDGDVVYKQDLLRIAYIQDHHYGKDISGRLDNKRIRQYIHVNNNILTVKENVYLEPIRHKVSFLVDEDSHSKKKTLINCKNLKTGEQKPVVENIAEFVGEELGDTWMVTAENDKSEISKEFVPVENSELFLVFDKSSYTPIGSAHLNQSTKKAEPSKKQSSRQPGVSNIGLIMVGVLVLTVYGLIFLTRTNLYKRTEIESNPNTEAQYGNTPADNQTNVDDSSNEISIDALIRYAEGIELNRDAINRYIGMVCRDDNRQNSSTPLQTSPESNNLAPDEETLARVCIQLKVALSIRTAIDVGDIKTLKNIRYSSAQRYFKNVIRSIRSSQSTSITSKLRMNPVPTKDLNEIADSIAAWQELLVSDRTSNVPNQIIAPENRPINNRIADNTEVEDSRTLSGSRNSENNRPVEGRNSSTPTAKAKNWTDPYERQFWAMIYSANLPPQSEFTTWYLNSNYMYNNKYKLFYIDYLRNSASFVNLVLLPTSCRRSVATIEDLIALMNNPNSCR